MPHIICRSPCNLLASISVCLQRYSRTKGTASNTCILVCGPIIYGWINLRKTCADICDVAQVTGVHTLPNWCCTLPNWCCTLPNWCCTRPNWCCTLLSWSYCKWLKLINSRLVISCPGVLQQKNKVLMTTYLGFVLSQPALFFCCAATPGQDTTNTCTHVGTYKCQPPHVYISTYFLLSLYDYCLYINSNV